MYSQIDANKRQTVLMFFIFFFFIIGVGWALSYFYNNQVILFIAVVIAVIHSWISYYASDTIALAATGAKKAPREQFLELHRIVENLAITAGIVQPKVYVVDDTAPNAFATGRDPKHAVVCVTSGLLAIMDKNELQGVLAHELSHVRNYDIRVMTVAVTLVGALVLVSDIMLRSRFWGSRDSRENNGGGYLIIIAVAFAILAPIFAKLIELAISRKREYLADASGVELTRYPEGLASALEKIEQYEKPMLHANRATAHLYINEPYGVKEEKTSWFATVFSTHPPIEDRVSKLRNMA